MELTPIIIIPTIFYFTYKFLESLVRRKERMMLIEKLDLSNMQALPVVSPLNLLDHMPNKRFSNLRAGLLISGIGFGLIMAWALAIGFYCPDNKSWTYERMFNVVYLAAPALFGGIGLIISYLIEQKTRNQE